MAILVAVTGWEAGPWVQRLQELAPQRRILETGIDGIFAGNRGDLEEVRYVLAWMPRPELLADLANLQVLFSLGAGVDHILGLPALPEVPIARIVDPDLTARMSEYVVWQVLHHHRQGFAHTRLQAERHWEELRQPAAGEVTVGIMGLGVLGRDAAGILVRLGFHVIGWSRSERAIDGLVTYHGKPGLDVFLGQSDILVSLLPLTPATRGLINRSLISRLKRDGPLGGPVLINAGRGGSQVDADIAAALADGTLVGASLDVFEDEPLPPGSPLWGLTNLVITPHVAAVSSPRALARNIIDQITAFESGQPLQNLVDPARGY
jgi:glyoxylate/hydroxypyruvate reductase A